MGTDTERMQAGQGQQFSLSGQNAPRRRVAGGGGPHVLGVTLRRPYYFQLA